MSPSKGVRKDAIMRKWPRDTLPFSVMPLMVIAELFAIVIVRHYYYFQNHLLTQRMPALETAKGLDDLVLFSFSLSSTWVTRNSSAPLPSSPNSTFCLSLP